MTTQDILKSLGQFSDFDANLFEKHSTKIILNKNEVLLKEGGEQAFEMRSKRYRQIK